MLTKYSGLVCSLVLASAASLQGAGLTVVLPENATYRYVNATAETTVGSIAGTWYTSSFDDSGWFTGQGAFGTSFGGDFSNVSGPNTPDAAQYTGATAWSPNYDPYLRTSFELESQQNLTLWIAVDNGVNSLYVNGVQATVPFNAEGTANRWEHVFDIPASFTVAGRNVIALQAEDHGGGTGFAMVVTSQASGVSENLFGTPEPGSVVLAMSGLGFLFYRRRQGTSVTRR